MELLMKAVIQRVTHAKVMVEGQITGQIQNGMLIFLGVAKSDDEQHAEVLAQKLATLRIFEDEAGKLNNSLLDTNGSALVVSNFTLYADCKKGRRPDFTGAAAYDMAGRLYEYFCICLKNSGVADVQTGVFGGDMQVELVNNGPVTVVLESGDFI
jgi:D-tyrosyl-tRNA(Tyr) deacylase